MKKGASLSLSEILLISSLLLVAPTFGSEVRRSVLSDPYVSGNWKDHGSTNNSSATLIKGQSINVMTIADFKIADTVCIGQNVAIQNLSTGGSSYYWNFCSGNLLNTPIGQNLGNQGNLNKPVYVIIVKDGVDCYSFITNLGDGTLTRNYYGSSFSNQPLSSVNLGNFGILPVSIESIQIKKSNGNWIGLINGGMHSNNFFRLNFGNSLKNIPVATDLGNISSVLNVPHTLYTFQENGNWYSFVANFGSNSVVRLSFGNSLANSPTGVDLGRIGAINGPVGLFPIQDNDGMWYLFVVNRSDNTISRLKFGNSLTNKPTGVNLGSISSLNLPRSITILRDCGQILGFVVNEGTNDLVRLTFPNGITSIPVGVSLGNIASFEFPHHISEVFRENDALYALITNVNNNTLSRIYFPGCTDSSIPSSKLQNPPLTTYNKPGIYNIHLVVDEGLPSQANVCKQIVVIGPPIVTIVTSNPTAICAGDQVTLIASGATKYSWSNGLGASKSITVKPTLNTTYTLKGTIAGCTGTTSSTVIVNPSPTVTISTSADPICAGTSATLTASGATSYLWDNNLGTTNPITVKPGSTATYTITGTTAGCTGTAKKTVTVNQNPTASSTISNGQMVINAMNGTPPYQYSINGTDFQLSGTFTGLQESEYKIYIKDLNNCTASIMVTNWDGIITIPNFFTPNNDGFHDTWEIKGIQNYPDATIQVFDRFGKLLTTYKGSDTGWNGIYKNTPLPSDDYWYVVKLGNNINALKGHVTLKH